MKDFINGFGYCFALFTAIGFAAFVMYCQPEKGYSTQERASVDQLFAEYNEIPRISLDDLK